MAAILISLVGLFGLGALRRLESAEPLPSVWEAGVIEATDLDGRGHSFDDGTGTVDVVVFVLSRWRSLWSTTKKSPSRTL